MSGSLGHRRSRATRAPATSCNRKNSSVVFGSCKSGCSRYPASNAAAAPSGLPAIARAEASIRISGTDDYRGHRSAIGPAKQQGSCRPLASIRNIFVDLTWPIEGRVLGISRAAKHAAAHRTSPKVFLGTPPEPAHIHDTRKTTLCVTRALLQRHWKPANSVRARPAPCTAQLRALQALKEPDPRGLMDDLSSKPLAVVRCGRK